MAFLDGFDKPQFHFSCMFFSWPGFSHTDIQWWLLMKDSGLLKSRLLYFGANKSYKRAK